MSETVSDKQTADTDLLSNAIGKWIRELDDYPGWKELQRGRFSRTLWYADPIPYQKSTPEAFVFSKEIELQHALCLQFMGLQATISSLRDLQYYFRRFPFRGLPITRYEHIANVCEMYFNRFYEFKTRLENYFEAFKAINPPNEYEYGKFIRLYNKVFDDELRARNGVHHDKRFDSIEIDNLFITHLMAQSRPDLGWRAEHLYNYRKVVKEWTARIDRRSNRLDMFLNAVAKMTLDSCDFLKPLSLQRSVRDIPDGSSNN